MTRDQIIQLAREAGIIDFRDAEDDPHVAQMVEFLESFAKLVEAAARADEREACAKVCEPGPSLPNEAYTVLNHKATMRRCAAAIRARKDNT
jgi:hypothetical protein